jgi:hypothetical protein
MAASATRHRSEPATAQCAPLLAAVNARRMRVDPPTAGFGIDAGSAAAVSRQLSPAAGGPTASQRLRGGGPRRAAGFACTLWHTMCLHDYILSV